MSQRPDDPALDAPPPRRPGRPRAHEPHSSVTAWLSTREHDRLIQLAKAQQTSVSSVVRQLLRLRLPR